MIMVEPVFFSDDFGNVFDAAWTLFMALDQTEEMLKWQNSSLEDFSYEREDITDMMFNNLVNQQFFGQSVRYRFIFP